MEVDNVQLQHRNDALKRAIETVTRATEHDLEGMYDDAVTMYDSALQDFDRVISQEKSQVVRDCVQAKMEAYAYRSDTLKKFLSRSRSPSSDGGSLGATDGDATETSASSDSGVDTVDDIANNSHNLSADSGADETTYSTTYEPRKHQQESRKQFLDACAEQVEQLLQIIRDESEPEEIKERARKRCVQILDFAEAYRRDFLPEPAAPPAGPVARTVSVASSVAAADPLRTHQLVHAEVLHSADQELDRDHEEVELSAAKLERGEDDECPEPPEDGDAEFHPLSFSIDSLRFADAESSGRSDSPDYATVRRATPSPRKHLSQSSLNRIETESEPLVGAERPGCAVLPAVARRPAKKRWFRRRHRSEDEPEPLSSELAEPSLFWVVLGSICG